MLATTTLFPLAGSVAYLRGTAEQARIQRRNADGTALVSIASRWGRTERASGTRTVPLADLFKTIELAMFGGKPPRESRRARRPLPRTPQVLG